MKKVLRILSLALLCWSHASVVNSSRNRSESSKATATATRELQTIPSGQVLCDRFRDRHEGDHTNPICVECGQNNYFRCSNELEMCLSENEICVRVALSESGELTSNSLTSPHFETRMTVVYYPEKQQQRKGHMEYSSTTRYDDNGNALVTECSLNWNREPCDCSPCDPSGSGTQDGVKVDCSVVIPGAAPQCTMREVNTPFEVLPTKVIAGIAIMDPTIFASKVEKTPTHVQKTTECNDFIDDAKKLSKDVASTECRVCTEAQLECEVRINEECLDSGLCFTSTLKEKATFAENNNRDDMELETVTTVKFTSDGYVGSGFTSVYRTRGVDSLPTSCDFYFSGGPGTTEAKCKFCGTTCSTPFGTVGFELDCTNIDPDFIDNCFEENTSDRFVVSPELVAYFSKQGKVGLPVQDAKPAPAIPQDEIPEPELMDEFDSNEHCENFQSQLQKMSVIMDEVDCPICNDMEIECMATSILDCLPEDMTAHDTCYTVQLIESFGPQGFMGSGTEEVVVDFEGTGRDESIRYIRRFEDGEQDTCEFSWNKQKCEKCDTRCATEEMDSGFSFDCSNIVDGVRLGCIGHARDEHMFPTKVIEYIAKENEKLVNTWERFCDVRFELTGQKCSSCNEDKVVCVDTPDDVSRCVNINAHDRICYSRVDSVEANFQTETATEKQVYTITEGSKLDFAQLAFKLDFSHGSITDSDVVGCSFSFDSKDCLSCELCNGNFGGAVGERWVTVDCTNLFGSNAFGTCMENADYMITKIVDEEGDDRNKKLIIPLTLVGVIVMLAITLNCMAHGALSDEIDREEPSSRQEQQSQQEQTTKSSELDEAVMT